MPNPTNHALSATVTATSTSAGYTVNGVKDGACSGSTGSWLSGVNQITNQAITFNLGSAQTFDTLQIFQAQVGANALIKDYELYVGPDGVNWGAAIATGTLTNTNVSVQTITFASQTKQYVKFLILNNYGHASYIGHLDEIRIFTTQTGLIAGASYVTTNAITGAIGNLRDNLYNTYSYVLVRGIPFLIDLGAAYWVDSILYVGYSGITSYHPRELYFLWSADGLLWNEFARVTIEQNTISYPIRNVSFPLINTRYLGIVAQREWTAAPGYTMSGHIIEELQIYSQTSPGAFSAITGLTAGTGADAGCLTAAWTAWTAAKAYRVYIRAGSAPDSFGTTSVYFLGEFDTGETAIDIWTLADRTTTITAGTNYYVIVRAVDNTNTEDTNTTSLSATPGTPGDADPPVWDTTTGVQSLGAGTGSTMGSLTATWGTATDAVSPPVQYRVYIRAGSAPNTFGTTSAYYLQTVEDTTIDIWTEADKVTPLNSASTYYVIVKAIDTVSNEDTNTTVLSATPHPGRMAGQRSIITA